MKGNCERGLEQRLNVLERKLSNESSITEKAWQKSCSFSNDNSVRILRITAGKYSNGGSKFIRHISHNKDISSRPIRIL